MSTIEQGCIDIWIDDVVPCLKDTETGDIKETVNGTKPKFLEKTTIHPSYYEQPNPYVNAPSCHVNLLESSRYAKQCGKRLIDLTNEEVQKFSI